MEVTYFHAQEFFIDRVAEVYSVKKILNSKFLVKTKMINLILLDPTIVIRTTPIAPVIWYEQNGIIFQDLKYDRFDEALQFFKENYIPFDTLCRAIDLIKHNDWVEEICETIRFLLKNDCSIIAVEKNSNKIVGVVVMTIMRHEERSWLEQNAQ